MQVKSFKVHPSEGHDFANDIYYAGDDSFQLEMPKFRGNAVCSIGGIKRPSFFPCRKS